MPQKRKTQAEDLKAPVAVEAMKGVRTLSELSAVHRVRPTAIAHWKRQLLEGAPEVFRQDLAEGPQRGDSDSAVVPGDWSA